MKILERIKTLFNKSRSNQVETIIISEKQCPHCVSRGMFVFNSPSDKKTKHGHPNEKSN
jgi:hypothetical protein